MERSLRGNRLALILLHFFGEGRRRRCGAGRGGGRLRHGLRRRRVCGRSLRLRRLGGEGEIRLQQENRDTGLEGSAPTCSPVFLEIVHLAFTSGAGTAKVSSRVSQPSRSSRMRLLKRAFSSECVT